MKRRSSVHEMKDKLHIKFIKDYDLLLQPKVQGIALKAQVQPKVQICHSNLLPNLGMELQRRVEIPNLRLLHFWHFQLPPLMI